MGKPKAPTPPSPTETAAAQTQSNRETAITQTGLNAMDQFGPGGSLTYDQVGTWADGTPRFQQTTALSPEQQAIYDTNVGTQTNLANLAQQQSGRLGDLLGEPLDWSAQQNFLNELTTQNLDPTWDRLRQQEASRLAQSGITPGSTSYDRQMELFNRSQSGAYNDALLNNFTTAQESQLANRNQGINEIIGLAEGTQVQNPQFAPTPRTGVAGTDVAGITQQGYANQVGAYNQQQQQMGGLFGTIGNLAGAALPFILSDERAKTDMKRVGKTDSGTPIYTYQYKGDPSGTTHMGVKAQDVPEASVPMGSMLAVDYKRVK